MVEAFSVYYDTAGNADDGDYNEGSLFLKGGTWRIDVVYQTNTTHGDVDLDFGSVEVLDKLDTSATASDDNIETKIVKLNQGKNLVRVAVNGNAGGGTDFIYDIQAIRGIRVGN